jgi:hypothetical protein
MVQKKKDFKLDVHCLLVKMSNPMVNYFANKKNILITMNMFGQSTCPKL